MSYVKTNEEGEQVVLQGVNSSTGDKYYPLGRSNLHGRRQIFTNVKEITSGNVIEVLNKALSVHLTNRAEMVYLEKYSRGIQPILDRIKKYNDYVCNKTVVNLASEILSFKVADHAGEPIQYVSRGKNEDVPEKIEELNSMMLSEGKQSVDMELAYQVFLYGAGYRLTAQDQGDGSDDYMDEAPFEIYVPDSRNSFVVRYNDVARKTVMAVNYVFLDETNNKVEYTVYTKNVTYTIIGTAQRAEKITKTVRHNFGLIPMVEYPCNSARIGAFEFVLDLLDAYNLTMSDRLDATEQFVQAIMVFEGVDINAEELEKMKSLGALRVPPGPDGKGGKVYYLNEQLDQQQTQTLDDTIKQTILEIVGMPSQGKANTSDSSNNGAMIIKNGWWHAEARKMETVGHWKKAESEFLKIILKICRDANKLEGLKVSDIETKFGTHSYQDLLTKSQTFTTLMDTGVPPIQAYKYSGLDSDPEAASLQYEEYRAAQEQKEEEKVQKELDRERERIAYETSRTVQNRGQGNNATEPTNPVQEE